jgi:hypothetical protein
MFLFLPFDIIIIKENSDVHLEHENLHHPIFGTSVDVNGNATCNCEGNWSGTYCQGNYHTVEIV